jgi:DNA-binding LacI/PurR family transcriptional regulator
MLRGRVKLTDLAEELGISPSTVSRALNKEGRISMETRKVVTDLANKWGYTPNPFAVCLLNKYKSGNIGIVVPSFSGSYFTKIVDSANKSLAASGYHLLINSHDGIFSNEVSIVNRLNQMRVEGLILCGASNQNSIDHLLSVLEDEVPVVLIDRVFEDMDASYVITDDFSGAQKAVNYMIKTGCKKIIHLKGPENLSTSFNRLMGYKESLHVNKIEFSDQNVISTEDCQWLDRLQELVSSNQVDGILAFNDFVAFDAVELLKKIGKKIPDEVSIIGFADEPVSYYMTPKLSTVLQPAEDVGRKAAEALLWHINNPTSDKLMCQQLPTQLLLRETTL